MDWTNILKTAGIPEPPGREEALQLALERSRAKAVRPKVKPKTKAKKSKQKPSQPFRAIN